MNNSTIHVYVSVIWSHTDSELTITTKFPRNSQTMRNHEKAVTQKCIIIDNNIYRALAQCRLDLGAAKSSIFGSAGSSQKLRLNSNHAPKDNARPYWAYNRPIMPMYEHLCCHLRRGLIICCANLQTTTNDVMDMCNLSVLVGLTYSLESVPWR